ncbi:MAG TPA: aldehyde dehydrogenase family protein [Acidimicrobiales bacterium]|nr:aldehyde dehydrogenase family protein [Acidimicrobiales bacterium]
MDKRIANRIGGQPSFPDGPTFDSTNPARPADVLATLPSSTGAEVDAAAAAATAAQRQWARRPVPARAEAIAAAAEVIAARKDELTRLVAREAGKILVEAAGDVQEAIDMGRFVAGQGRAAAGDTVPSELPGKLAWTTRQPVGVVGMITPWNFPVAIPSWKCFPALLAGNGIVIKPSEEAPACADAFVECLADAGVPADLVNVVHGTVEPGTAIAVHPGIAAVSFTGSVPTGRVVAATAMAAGPKLVSLELGGKNAMVVLADADLELAVEGALFGAFGTAGQRCTSTSRLVLHRAVADELVARLAERAEKLVLGDPLDPATDVGPVINARAGDRILGMVAAARDEGGDIVIGGKAVTVAGCDGGTFVTPTIVRVERDHRIAREEVFGPVLAVIVVDDVADAVDVVNDTEYGLSAAVYTRDINAALWAVERVETGIVYVNAPTIGAEIPLPFGGTKHTGNGFREAGTRGIEQFSHVKTVYVDYSGQLQKAQIDTHPFESEEG